LEFQSQPQIEIPHQPRFWTDPKSGLEIPMGRTENLARRKFVLERCETDPRFRASILKMCADSPVLWVSLFGWTRKFFEVGVDGISVSKDSKLEPFIPWPSQIALMERIHNSILKGTSFLLEKSREIGASWMYLYVFTHHFLFRRGCEIGLLSRIEDDVDSLMGDVKGYPLHVNSDPATLLGKIDYCLQHLPQWMLPRLARKRLHIFNLDGKCRLDGGASAEFAFTGQRRDAVYFDEAAKNPNFKSIWDQTTDVTLCKLPVSTPVGKTNYFAKVRFSGQIPIETFGWWLSPEKASDLTSVEIAPGKWKLTSSWYAHQCTIRSPNDIASNLDIDYLESGTPFFEGLILDKHKKSYGRDPLLRLRIEFKRDVPESEIRQIILRRDLTKVQAVVDSKGPWSLWTIPPNPNPHAKEGEYDKLYGSGNLWVFGCDTSLGMGASNSVISVINKRTRHKIAEFADSRTPPHSFAKQIAAAALWFGSGSTRPLVVPEANGNPGFDLLRQLSRIYSYPEIYRATTTNRDIDKVTANLGWSSSRSKKALMLGNLRREYAVGRFVNPSVKAIEEATDYIVAETGSIEPSSLTEESESAKSAHGDRVIADALALWPGSEHEIEEPKPQVKNSLDGIENAPPGSPGYRIRTGGYLNPPKDRTVRDLRLGDKFKVTDFI